MTPRRRLVLLAALLVASIGYFVSTRGPQLFSGQPSRRFGGSTRVGQVVGAQVARLNTGALKQKPGTYSPGRDLFRYGQNPGPKQPPTRKRTPPPQPKPQPQTEAAQDATPARPTPPPIDVAYVGSFGRSGRKIAVFIDEETIYNAMVGDVVKDAFLLVEIGFESVDLKFVGFPDVEAERLAVGGS